MNKDIKLDNGTLELVIGIVANEIPQNRLADKLGISEAGLSRKMSEYYKAAINAQQSRVKVMEAKVKDLESLKIAIDKYETQVKEPKARLEDKERAVQELSTACKRQERQFNAMKEEVNRLQAIETVWNEWKGQIRFYQWIDTPWALVVLFSLLVLFDVTALQSDLYLAFEGLCDGPERRFLSVSISLGIGLCLIYFSRNDNNGARIFSIVVTFLAAALMMDFLVHTDRILDAIWQGGLPERKDMVKVFFSFVPATLMGILSLEMRK